MAGCLILSNLIKLILQRMGVFIDATLPWAYMRDQQSRLVPASI